MSLLSQCWGGLPSLMSWLQSATHSGAWGMICPRGLEYVKTDLITYRSFVRHRKLKGVLCTKLLPSCPNLCNPTDCSMSGKNTGVGCHVFLQGIFLTQGLNLGLLHCRQTPYCLSHPRREPFQTLMCLLHWQVGSLPRAPPQQAKSVCKMKPNNSKLVFFPGNLSLW